MLWRMFYCKENFVRNVLLTIQYDGTNFSGWQRQPGVRTVCGRLEEVLSVICKEDVKLDATSRTDAGVHALGQRATLRGSFEIPADRIPIAANTMLADDRIELLSDVRILEAREMPPGFHARFDAKGKRYVYRIANAPEPDIFRRNYCYQVRRPLDTDAMRRAAEIIRGEHDFRAFMSMGSTPQDSTVRNVRSIAMEQDGSDITIKVEGDGFLYNMVRIIVGTMVEVGLGRRSPAEVRLAVETGDRTKAGHVAPPQGLYLDEVFYEQTVMG